jgi:DNA-binding response OmpR family regulator
VSWQGKSSLLSQREFSLVEFLMRTPGHIYSRQEILKHVWAISFNPETNVVDVYIQRIRKKLNRNQPEGIEFPIETIRGVGYRFCDESNVSQ